MSLSMSLATCSDAFPSGIRDKEHAASIARYSRQMLAIDGGASTLCGAASSSMGVRDGESVKGARLGDKAVLIVGAGGLGCPAALYLAGAGVARLGIADFDNVEVSNLHRQVAHTESAATTRTPKVVSLIAACRERNSKVQYEAYESGVDASNAVDIIARYDVVLDATDNATARYIVNDACVVTGVPLVSGACVGVEGQLSVYNHGENAPCYRCVFPTPPRVEHCSRCDEAGVLGPVPGVIGAMQALEAVKVLANIGNTMAGRMLIFDGLAMRNHVVRLRGKSDACPAHRMTAADVQDFDYAEFTGVRKKLQDGGGSQGASSCASSSVPSLSLLTPEKRIDVTELDALFRRSFDERSDDVVLIDVRPTKEYAMVRLEPSMNVPIDRIDIDAESIKDAVTIRTNMSSSDDAAGAISQHRRLIVLCRRGNDSQRAVRILEQRGIPCQDVRGGLVAWQKQIDSSFPLY